MTKADRIVDLYRQRDWRAALVILLHETFMDDGRVWAHVDLEKERIHFDRMLEDGTFSGGERRLLEIAASLFSTDHQVNLWSILSGLDDTHTSLALYAISTFCGRK
jgi:ABC-type lipopolysaccharide export system ATPase subunit